VKPRRNDFIRVKRRKVVHIEEPKEEIVTTTTDIVSLLDMINSDST
jgi:hypothetical protein